MSIILPPNPVLLNDDGKPLKKKKKREDNASTGATAASMRALIAFYFRAPMKAFFRPRVE